MSIHPTCSIEGCERNHYARTWCSIHYQRWRRNGDPVALKQAGSHPKYCDSNGVIAAIQRYSFQHGYPPTIRELGKLVGFSSTENVRYWLDKLREEGKVDWVEGKARTIRVLEAAQ